MYVKPFFQIKHVKPSCKDCIHYSSGNKCKMFKLKSIATSGDRAFQFYLDTDTARSYKELCGPTGTLFELQRP
jgi:hypothetical protein